MLLKNCFESSIKDEILNKGVPVSGLKGNTKMMHEIADSTRVKLLKSKEINEMLITLFNLSRIYPGESEVCFVVKNSLNPRKASIQTLNDLIDHIEENSITDFGILSSDGLRQFQVKQYKGILDADSIFSFIEKNLKHYAYDMGDVNLFIVLQGEGGFVSNDLFRELTRKIDDLELKFKSEILISYNKNNEFDVINRVYPSLATLRKQRPKEFTWHSEQ